MLVGLGATKRKEKTQKNDIFKEPGNQLSQDCAGLSCQQRFGRYLTLETSPFLQLENNSYPSIIDAAFSVLSYTLKRPNSRSVCTCLLSGKGCNFQIVLLCVSVTPNAWFRNAVVMWLKGEELLPQWSPSETGLKTGWLVGFTTDLNGFASIFSHRIWWVSRCLVWTSHLPSYFSRNLGFKTTKPSLQKATELNKVI